MYRKIWKRALDILLSAGGLLLLSPLFFLLMLLVLLDGGGPVFFRQKRVGCNRSSFYILKFRTMRADAPHDMPTHQLVDAQAYITRIGAFLRKSSLDELPQLVNILGGSMSVIGPRPALWNQEDLIDARERYGANAIRPGLTGWAQINGRDELPTAEKARLDGEYVENLRFSFDCKCFFGTILAVLRRDGVAEGALGLSVQGQGKEKEQDDKNFDYRR